jgi:hypothetical protein
MAALRAATEGVRRLALFSSNETVDDVATGDLKYLLVPFYLAEARRQSALAACVTTAVLLLCGDGAGAGADARIAALLRAAAGAVAR